MQRAAANKPVAAQENACADVCAYVAVKKGNAPDLRKRPRNSNASGTSDQLSHNGNDKQLMLVPHISWLIVNQN